MSHSSCPTCHKYFRHKVIRENGRVDIFCGCGYTWNGYNDFQKFEEEMNEFYGKWTDDEIFGVIEAIENSRYCDDDRRLFKGRVLYTIWASRSKPQDVKAFAKFKSLLDRV